MRDGMVYCPRKWSGMARDACIQHQVEDLCGAGCREGQLAILGRRKFDKHEDVAEPAIAREKAFNRHHYQRWGKKQYAAKRIRKAPRLPCAPA